MGVGAVDVVIGRELERGKKRYFLLVDQEKFYLNDHQEPTLNDGLGEVVVGLEEDEGFVLKTGPNSFHIDGHAEVIPAEDHVEIRYSSENPPTDSELRDLNNFLSLTGLRARIVDSRDRGKEVLDYVLPATHLRLLVPTTLGYVMQQMKEEERTVH